MLGAAGEALLAVTLAHMSVAQMIQILCVREGKGLAFVPFSSPISCLSTKLLWRWILGRTDQTDG